MLVLNWVPGRYTSWFIIFGIWFCTALVVGIPNIFHRHHTYYGNTGFCTGLPFFSRNLIDNFIGCYINSKYTVERLVTDYVWLWLTGLVMVVLYSIMAVMIYHLGRGNINKAEHTTVARKLILYIPHFSSFCHFVNFVAQLPYHLHPLYPS